MRSIKSGRTRNIYFATMNHSPKPSSKNIGLKRKSLGTFEPLKTRALLPTPQTVGGGSHPETGHLLLDYALQNPSTFLPAVSPANPSLKLDEEKERTMTASSGQKCLGLFESSNQHGSSVKMLRDCLVSSKAWFSNKSSLTWKVKVTKSNASLYQLSPSMRRTEGTGSGLLQTPRATEHKENQARFVERNRGQNHERISKSHDAGSVNASNSSGAGLEGRKQDEPTGQRGQPHRGRSNERREWSRNWLEVATELCGMDDGLSARMDGLELSKSKHRQLRLKALGNAIVPQVAVQIFEAIKYTEATWRKTL